MTKRILSLDGGGIKGVFPAAFLASIEEEVEGSIGEYFDLIVGTSTGGIIALGLGLGFAAKELLSFYQDLGSQVFAGNRFLRFLRQLGLSKYKPGALKKALECKFSDMKLGDSTVRLVIPSLNLETGEVHVFKTAHHPRFEKDWKESTVSVGLATAAAPTYFPSHETSSGMPLIDGGMWANNPAGPAVVEAIGVLEWDRANLKVLSVGCTESPLDVGLGRRCGMGVFYWAKKVSAVFMCAQSSASLGTAKLLAGHNNVHRISPIVPARRFGLDVIKEIESLKGLGFSEARKALPNLKPVFFSQPAEKFVPYHPRGKGKAI
jgi:patatin-like phospholipase/acyl hydrolase